MKSIISREQLAGDDLQLADLVPRHCTGALPKLFCFDSELVEHGKEQVAERRPFFLRDVLSVFVAATGE